MAAERRDAYFEVVGDVRLPWPEWRSEKHETADDVRRHLGVTIEEIARAADERAALRLWIRAIEAAGVLVFQMSRVPVEECRGFALDDERLPVITLNGADAPQARCFTLLHELGHLLDRTGALCLLDDSQRVEQRCNAFAAAVLMPAGAVHAAAADLEGDPAVASVARAFKVSPVAAALRLRTLGIIGQEAVATALRDAAEATRRAAEQTGSGGPAPHLLKRRNLGEPYVGAVLDAMHREAITVLDAAYLLETKVATVERFERGA